MLKCPAIVNNYKNKSQATRLQDLISSPENTGNIIFLESIESQINDCLPVNIHYDFLEHPQEFFEKHNAIILPFANMVSSTWKANANFLDLLEKSPIPVILVSIGIQANTLDDIQKIKLSTDAKKLLDIAKATSTSIGVRGQYTAEMLYKLGYNVDIIGCPSLLGKLSPMKKLTSISKIATHCTLTGNWKQEISNLFAFSYKYAQGYVGQSELRFFIDKYDISDETLSEWIQDPYWLKIAKNRLYEYQYYSNENISAENLKKWIRENLTHFTDLVTWKEYLSTFDLTFGTRFHGNAVSIIAGTPALFFTTDIRTQELAKVHKFPNLPFSKFTENLTIEDIVSRIDYTEFNEQLSINRSNYEKFLNKNGLILNKNYIL